MLPCSALYHGSRKSIDRAPGMEHFFIYFWNEIRLFQAKTCCWSLKNYNYNFKNYSKKTDVIVRAQLIPKTLKLFEEISLIGDELKFVIIQNFGYFVYFLLFQDYHGTSNNAPPQLDAVQNYELLGGFQNDTHTVIQFQRHWNTCDYDHDKPLGVNIKRAGLRTWFGNNIVVKTFY